MKVIFLEDQELSLIGRALLDKAGRQKELLSKTCEEEIGYQGLELEYAMLLNLIRKIKKTAGK